MSKFKINDQVISKDLGIGRVTSCYDGMVTVSYGGFFWKHLVDEVEVAPKKTRFLNKIFCK